MLHFQRIAFNFKANGLRSGPQKYHFGDQKDSQMIKNRSFLIRGAPEGPPGAPKASWTAYTAADCTLPPGTLVNCLYRPAPAPGPGETTLTYCFQPLSLYLLASSLWFLIDSHATTLVPRGRRIPRAAPSAADPEKKKRRVQIRILLMCELKFL